MVLALPTLGFSPTVERRELAHLERETLAHLLPVAELLAGPAWLGLPLEPLAD
jgi:hypothetical protein